MSVHRSPFAIRRKRIIIGSGKRRYAKARKG
jgi:hypothetical protein